MRPRVAATLFFAAVARAIAADSPPARPGTGFAPGETDPGREAAQLEVAAAHKAAIRKPVARQPDGNGLVVITGELKQWHKVTLNLAGPFAAETDTVPNPFTDLALSVTFTHESGAPRYVVPGHFAVDGRAAHTSATSGTGAPFLKAGADAPETLLAYTAFATRSRSSATSRSRRGRPTSPTGAPAIPRGVPRGRAGASSARSTTSPRKAPIPARSSPTTPPATATTSGPSSRATRNSTTTAPSSTSGASSSITPRGSGSSSTSSSRKTKTTMTASGPSAGRAACPSRSTAARPAPSASSTCAS